MHTNNGQIQKSDAIAALPDWMMSIRNAITGAIGADDLSEILKVQIEKAKKGDEKAARFVLDQAKAFADLRGVSITQNNNYYNDGDRDGSDQATRHLVPTHRPPRNPFK